MESSIKMELFKIIKYGWLDQLKDNARLSISGNRKPVETLREPIWTDLIVSSSSWIICVCAISIGVVGRCDVERMTHIMHARDAFRVLSSEAKAWSLYSLKPIIFSSTKVASLIAPLANLWVIFLSVVKKKAGRDYSRTSKIFGIAFSYLTLTFKAHRPGFSAINTKSFFFLE